MGYPVLILGPGQEICSVKKFCVFTPGNTALMGRMETSLIPLSETTSMPLSCAEPGEGAVQLPYPITKPTLRNFAPPSISRKRQEGVGYKPSAATPHSVVVPSNPASTPRFRLELPRFSTFSRKERTIESGQQISTGCCNIYETV